MENETSCFTRARTYHGTTLCLCWFRVYRDERRTLMSPPKAITFNQSAVW